jgi:hypothetical protein
MPKKKTFPLFGDASRHMTNLKKGDCIFVPAYNFYQMEGLNLGKKFSNYRDHFDNLSSSESNSEEELAMATIVGLKF